MRIASPKVFAALIVLVAAGLGGWMMMHPTTPGKSGDPAAGAPAISIRVAAAVRQDMPLKISSVGTAVPYQTVNIKSRIDSQIMAIHFQDGDEVKKGDVLFQLDDRALKAQLDQAAADLTRDEAQLKNLNWQLERNKQLIDQKAISEQVFQESKAASDAQAASVVADQSAIENLKVQLTYTTIKAPIDGRTGTINVTTGNNVKANDTVALVTLNQIHPLLVQISLPQKNFSALRAAMVQGIVPVLATIKPGHTQVEGQLKYIDNTIDQDTGTFATRAEFKNTDEKLWPGMLVPVVIRIGTDKNMLVIPEVAVQSTPRGNFVFVIQNNKAEKREIKLDRMQGGYALIDEGLKEGENVATDGMLLLGDGSTVTIDDSAQAAKKEAP